MANAGGDPPDAAPVRAAPVVAVSRPAERQSLYDFDPDHKRRAQEATVKKLEIEAEQADNDRQMRKSIAEDVFAAIKWQVGIADVAFLIYGFWNAWNIPSDTVDAWLGAVVVQVIAVGLVIARSLFPSGSSA
jgi:hypothetical protein